MRKKTVVAKAEKKIKISVPSRAVVKSEPLKKPTIDVAKIFNLENLNAYPERVRKNVKGEKPRSNTGTFLIELFKLKPVLSLDELVVGVYNLFGLEKDRGWIGSSLTYLKNQGVIKNVQGVQGVYELIK